MCNCWPVYNQQLMSRPNTTEFNTAIALCVHRDSSQAGVVGVPETIPESRAGSEGRHKRSGLSPQPSGTPREEGSDHNQVYWLEHHAYRSLLSFGPTYPGNACKHKYLHNCFLLYIAV